MEKETTWIDAWIRWDRNSKDVVVDEEENDDCEDEAKVTPTTEFSFDYKLLPERECDSCGSGQLDLTLALKGFPSESEQIWNSTGLTLWPSSHYLCDYLLHHYRELLSIVRGASLDNPRNNLEDETKTTTTQERIPGVQRNICAVELGSGLGRCGLLLHHLMKTQNSIGSHVYLTDGDTDTLAQLRDNVTDNTDRGAIGGTESMTSTEDDDQNNTQQESNPHDISCHQLLWGRDLALTFCEHHFSNASTSKTSDCTSSTDLDNHRVNDRVAIRTVDLVFGSDLIYAPRVIVPLFETVSTLLKNGNATDLWQQQQLQQQQQQNNSTAKTGTKSMFLMAHSDRREGSSVTLNMVLEGAKLAGLEFEILQKVEREGIYVIAFQIQQPVIS